MSVPENRDANDDLLQHGFAGVKEALTRRRPMLPEVPPYGDDQAGSPLSFDPTPFTFRDPATIPRRDFLYGFELRRKQVSAVVGVGAGGKTTFKVGRAIAMVTGREIFGHRVWNGPHRVWLVNLEDEREEIEKCVHAYLKGFNIPAADLADRLFIDGIDTGAMAKLKMAVEGERGGFLIQRPVVEAAVEALVARKIDYLDIDPFVSSHSIDENNNGAIDAVSKEWVQVARRANCAVSLAHHVRKPSGGEASAFDARGAVAMINACRSVLVLQKMSKEVSDSMCVPECDRKKYVSVYDDKNNKAPPATAQDWYEFISVGLGNGDDTGPEDSIGALQRWQAPNAFGGATPRQLHNIQTAISTADKSKTRKHSASPGWVGKLVAYVLDLNCDDPKDKAFIAAAIKTWLANGALRTVSKPDKNHDPREHVEVGTWAEVDR